jgi:hypothetical protein
LQKTGEQDAAGEVRLLQGSNANTATGISNVLMLIAGIMQEGQTKMKYPSDIRSAYYEIRNNNQHE